MYFVLAPSPQDNWTLGGKYIYIGGGEGGGKYKYIK